MQEYLIYKITNLSDGKSYIGRTKDLERRICQHIKSDVCRYLHRAIKKYGIISFSIEVLENSLDFSEAKRKEGEFIKVHNTLAPNGYNLLAETEDGREPCEETRKAMGSSQQKRKRQSPGFKGVRKIKGGNKFNCRLNYNKKTYGGNFTTENEAAETYDKLALFLFGNEATINFEGKRQDYLKLDLKSFFEEKLIKKKNTSKYEGVSFHTQTGKWRAYYYKDKKMISLGLHKTEQEAHERAKQYYK